jgi:hypothetical protein
MNTVSLKHKTNIHCKNVISIIRPPAKSKNWPNIDFYFQVYSGKKERFDEDWVFV